MKCPKILSLLLMILLLSTGYASAAPSQTLKIAAGDPEDSEMGVVGNAFKEYIEEKTKGDVEKTRPADPALPVLQHRRSGNGHQQSSCGIVEQLCHKIRIPYPDVDLYGLPLHLQCQAPHHQDGRHAGPEVPRAPERRADRRL